MLHVILTILKIIGILLLVLIALVILLLLALLFVPIRYQIECIYTDENKEGNVHLSWLLHFLTVRLDYDLSLQEGGVKIRVLGIDPGKVSGFFKKRKKSTKSQKSAPAGPEKKSNSEGGVKPENTQQKKEETKQKESEPKQGTAQTEKKDASPQKKPSKKKRRPARKKRSLYDRIVNFFKKQVYKLRGICDRIEKIRDSWGILRETEQRAARLLHHYRVRVGSGYLRFGTGDPAATAELTGFLYILLPASCGNVTIDPQFTEETLETELKIRGHVRLIHLLTAVLWGVFNKDLRQLIRDLGNS